MKTLSNLSTRLYCMAAAKRQKGVTIIEYVLLAAGIGIALTLTNGFPTLVLEIQGAFSNIGSKINP